MYARVRDKSISTNADGPRDAASRKIDRIALHAERNHHAAATLRAISNPGV